MSEHNSELFEPRCKELQNHTGVRFAAIIDKNGNKIAENILKYFKKKYSIINIPESICLGCIYRDGKFIIPSYTTKLKSNDELLLFLKPINVSKAENLFQ